MSDCGICPKTEMQMVRVLRAFERAANARWGVTGRFDPSCADPNPKPMLSMAKEPRLRARDYLSKFPKATIIEVMTATGASDRTVRHAFSDLGLRTPAWIRTSDTVRAKVTRELEANPEASIDDIVCKTGASRTWVLKIKRLQRADSNQG